jgi:hypothetical protein
MKLSGRSRSAAIVAVLAVATLGACSDDTTEDADDPISNVIVDEEFPGDALDATCNRLDATSGDDDTARAAEVFADLIEIGGEESAAVTLRQATIDRCPEWYDAVEAAIGG